MSLLLGLAKLNFARYVSQLLNESAVEIEDLDLWCERIGVVDVCQPETLIRILVVDSCGGHRSAHSEVFVVVYPQIVSLFIYRVDEVKAGAEV